jgi:hypothetical protein
MPLAGGKGAAWRWIAAAALAGLIAAYLAWGRAGGYAHGGSAFGFATGVAAFLLVLFLAAFGLRKRAYRSRWWGSLEGWLQAHAWLGLVTLALVILHSGFRFRDAVAVGALALLALVVATGVWGAFLYAAVPRLLTDVARNVPLADTSAEMNRLDADMARLADGKSPVFRRIHQALVAEARPRPLAGWRLLVGRAPRLAGAPSAAQTARLRQIPDGEREELREMLDLSRRHKELHQRLLLEQRYRNQLRAWLFLHVPMTFALLVAMTLHAVAALRYGGLPWGG